MPWCWSEPVSIRTNRPDVHDDLGQAVHDETETVSERRRDEDPWSHVIRSQRQAIPLGATTTWCSVQYPRYPTSSSRLCQSLQGAAAPAKLPSSTLAGLATHPALQESGFCQADHRYRIAPVARQTHTGE